MCRIPSLCHLGAHPFRLSSFTDLARIKCFSSQETMSDIKLKGRSKTDSVAVTDQREVTQDEFQLAKLGYKQGAMTLRKCRFVDADGF